MIRIFLIGYMGAGKTTLGKALARTLGLSFLDMDWFIENRFHKKIEDLFEERGESGFRELERRVLQEVSEFEDVIISTGGGTPCFFDNMDVMNQQGSTVFLNVQLDMLFHRLRLTTAARPILKGKADEELRAHITQALEERLPFYTRAQYTFDANELDNRWQIDESARRLCRMLEIDYKQR